MQPKSRLYFKTLKLSSVYNVAAVYFESHKEEPGAEAIKLFVLNSTEHEISIAHKW